MSRSKAIQVFDGDGVQRGHRQKRYDWDSMVLKDVLLRYQSRVVTFGEGFIEIGVINYVQSEADAFRFFGDLAEYEGIALSIKLQWSEGDQRMEGPYVGVVGQVKPQLQVNNHGVYVADLFIRLLT